MAWQTPVSRHRAPCKDPSDLCKDPSDPCKDPSDPCKDPSDPCKDPSEPCKDPSDLCKDPSEPCKDPSEPCKDPSDPCKALDAVAAAFLCTGCSVSLHGLQRFSARAAAFLCTGCRVSLQALEHSIYGNGAIGIKEQLREIRENQKKLQRLYWTGLGVMSVVTPVISGIIIKLFMN